MSEIILLSSDDEAEPSVKRPKLEKSNVKCFVLSDNDTSDIEMECKDQRVPLPKMEINSKERVEIFLSKCKNNSNSVKPETMKVCGNSNTSAVLKSKRIIPVTFLKKNKKRDRGFEQKIYKKSPLQIDLTSQKHNYSKSKITPNNTIANNCNGAISLQIVNNEAATSKSDLTVETESKTPDVETNSDSFCTENQENNVNNSNNADAPSIESQIQYKFFNFLDKCRNCIHLNSTLDSDNFTRKILQLEKYAAKLIKSSEHVGEFEHIINWKMEQLQKFPETMVKYFVDVYKWSKVNCIKMEQQTLLTGNQKFMLYKLEKTLHKVQKRIKMLDETVVDFSDEENSHYLQTTRYKQRAVQIYNKICEIKKQDPNAGNSSYFKLDFCKSSYPYINHALNKMYKNILVFPTFYDVDKCIRKCVKTHNLDILENDLKEEIRNCFKSLAELIQKQRQIELLSHHNDYVESNIDPATEDPELEQKLRGHYKEASKKRSEIVQKYIELQHQGVNPNVSSDSDDSNAGSKSENENSS